MLKNLLFLFFVTSFSSALAQNHDHLHPCGVEQPGLKMDHTWLRDYQQHPENYPMPEDDLIIAAMAVHNLGNDDGTGYFNWSSMLTALCQLQEAFAPSDVQFYLANGINFIPDTDWNNHESFGLGSQMMNANEINGMLNSYICSEAAGNCGYYSPGPDACVVAKNCASASDETWAHEIGHYLSLPHTFFGWEGIDFDPQLTASDYQGQPFTPIEDADGSNCSFAADGFCDTAPDYISYRWTCNDENETNATYTDLNGDEFKITGTPYMSYSNGLCKQEFSQEQTDAMRANLIFQRGNVILDDVVIEEINMADFTPVYPINEEEVPYNYVKLEWQPVPNATHYYVEVMREPFGVVLWSGMTEATEFVVTDMTPGKDFSWEVRPFNWGYFCASTSEKAEFKSSLTVTAVNEIEGVEEVEIFPTILQNGQALTVQFASNESLGQAQITLTDLTGKAQQTAQINIQTGQNQWQFVPNQLNAGIYLVGVTTNKGSYYEKVILQ